MIDIYQSYTDTQKSLVQTQFIASGYPGQVRGQGAGGRVQGGEPHA
ncbi:hypothetical protein NIES3585_26750 [Nodularia sp. NIES-3585]|nr:hypothetical protein NIES3585_26750 [Nodularia sp. NIES-3585]